MRKKLLVGLVAGLMGVVLQAQQSSAVTIDFEGVALGTYSSLTFTDLTITYTGGDGQFDVESESPGWPISGHCLISYFQNPGAAPFLVTFTNPAASFSIGVGDYDADEDNTYLQAFDSGWNLLDSDYYWNPGQKYGGNYLTVDSPTPIKYVKFWDDDPYAGAVYWDNMSYTLAAPPIPEASTYALFGVGSLGLLFWRRRRQVG